LIQTLSMMIILQGALLALTQGAPSPICRTATPGSARLTIGTWPMMPLIVVVALIAIAVSCDAPCSAAASMPSAAIRVGLRRPASASTGSRSSPSPCPAFIAGVAGFLLASWQMAITSNQGSKLSALRHRRADHRRGQRVRRPRQSVLGVLGGVLLLTVIQVGLAIISLPSFYVGMIGGVMIFIAVAIDAIRVRMSPGR
jgi:simple sugar transport system permease protein